MGHIYLSHLMGRFPWDSHRNDIPMDKPDNWQWSEMYLKE